MTGGTGYIVSQSNEKAGGRKAPECAFILITKVSVHLERVILVKSWGSKPGGGNGGTNRM